MHVTHHHRLVCFVFLNLAFGVSYLQSQLRGLPKLPLFAVCNPDAKPSQCGMNAICGMLLPGTCDRGRCMCASTELAPRFNNATDCGPILKPGEACSTNGDDAMLIPENAQCIGGFVTCSKNLVSGSGICVASNNTVSRPDEKCDDDIAICNSAIGLECRRLALGNQCQCPSPQIFKNGKCQFALFGDSCKNDRECNAIYENPSESIGVCLNGTCGCSSAFMALDAVVKTMPSSTLMQNNVTSILGFYCMKKAISLARTGEDGDNCSLASPKPKFDKLELESNTLQYCKAGFVCLHCAESGSLTKGKCNNITTLLATKFYDSETMTTPAKQDIANKATGKQTDDSSTPVPAAVGSKNHGTKVELFSVLFVITLVFSKLTQK